MPGIEVMLSTAYCLIGITLNLCKKQPAFAAAIPILSITAHSLIKTRIQRDLDSADQHKPVLVATSTGLMLVFCE